MKESRYSQDNNKLPDHVAIIMDGNGRWAREHALTRAQGHKAGVENLRPIIEVAHQSAIKFLTVYAFSTENWQRPKEEVECLMHLLEYFLEKELQELIEKKIKINLIGDYTNLPKSAVDILEKAIKLTNNFNELTFTLALNYSSRAEVLQAVKKLIIETSQNNKSQTLESLNWETFSNYLYTHNLPDPDLIIRTSGESRLSNFLLLQGAYAEIYLTPVYWPNFKKEDFENALTYYANRERRFGLTSDQIITLKTS